MTLEQEVIDTKIEVIEDGVVYKVTPDTAFLGQLLESNFEHLRVLLYQIQETLEGIVSDYE